MARLKGCGLGLRREFIHEVIPSSFKPDFWEVTPENWINMPYYHKERFEQIVYENKTIAHGLSLSIGSDKRPSKKFLKTIKEFLDRYKIEDYSEHISFSNFNGSQTYELLPLPSTMSMVELLSNRVKYVEDFLGRSLILENATYYYVPDAKMSEVEFINELIHKSGVRLLLDVNNVYVNSVNHNYDARKFLSDLDTSSVAYMHLAGHFDDEDSGFLVDTHGMEVTKKVWDLYKYTLKKVKAPTMIERDNNVPSLDVMIKEYDKLKRIYRGA